MQSKQTVFTVQGYKAAPQGKIHLFPKCTSLVKNHPPLSETGLITITEDEICVACWAEKVRRAKLKRPRKRK